MRDEGVIGKIEQQEWLKPAEEGLQKAIHKSFEFRGGRQVKNFLHGTWIGHPLHVILTDVPIGAWTTAVFFDALDSMSSRREYRVAADAALGLGLVSAMGAAATGLADWQDIDPPARRVGLVHGLLNIASVVLFGSSLMARRAGKRSTGRSLAALGYAVSVGAARLGGNLVYGQKIGVDHSMPEKLPEDFTPVLSETKLQDGQPVRAEHNGTPILLVRRGSEIFALAETCSHLGGPLSEGKLDGDVIQCPWHGSRFSIRDGHVVDGPAVHPQPCLEARIRNGEVEVRRSDCRAPRTASNQTEMESQPRTGTTG
ncbi:MAG TPA: Rieske 2Fe-2S domain-containing protein [Candidatus Sulfotelmatobacter sp.]|nr:Rieske 2Fe-2S domain-containing protein [Candidatus Sulfotelmatobacter sp.]